ncbi:hypothetical protein BGI03_00155 [Snodgrassella alvi]|uniref:hypothetical protein n=1 Tax=Snodgrassella alvi TaxID=1196083 RepID=UPI0009FF404B|nr:hypothetical protein [Snodgrassella alvi]ORF09907.1 hypothetical protein BGH98_00170 [Snodgrassella alvi]ORF16555.1 hypothetical protein BGI01_00095 [Snodgrassella alvi]ORF22554.1 hypothetical protein BGI03_00155 [Snodgrassella alvi]ORF22791.1 hypothetical protein BGI04_00215 [Snodgrassella alvi]
MFDLFAGQAASAVVLKTGIHSALAAQGFSVQVIALDVADNLSVQVNLVQMPGTIIQFVDSTITWIGLFGQSIGSILVKIDFYLDLIIVIFDNI